MLNENLMKAKSLLEKHKKIAAIKQILHNQKAWNDLETHNNLLRNQLFAIAATEQENGTNLYSQKLYQDVYAVLILFANLWPLNETEEGENGKVYRSIFSLCSVEDPVYTANGHQFEMSEIPDLMNYGSNPLDRTPLPIQEKRYLEAKIRQTNTVVDLAAEAERANWRAEMKFQRRIEMLENAMDYLIVSTLICIPLLMTVVLPIIFFVNVFAVFTLLVAPAISVPVAYFYAYKKYKENEPLATDADIISNAESLIPPTNKTEESVSKSSTAIVQEQLNIDASSKPAVNDSVYEPVEDLGVGIGIAVSVETAPVFNPARAMR